MSSTAFIDADLLVYRCAFVAQTRRYDLVRKQDQHVIKSFRYAKNKPLDEYENGEKIGTYVVEGYNDWIKDNIPARQRDKFEIVADWNLEPLSFAIKALDSTIGAIIDAVNCVDHFFYLTDGDSNFRKELATILPYKGNRKEKPVYFEELRDYLLANYDAILCKGYEADDAIVDDYEAGHDTGDVIVSTDKDLFQQPGKFYNFVTEEFIEISEAEADRHYFTQVLTGDMTDNIPGLPGIGPKKAEKILANSLTYEDMEEAVESAYKQILLETKKGKEFLNQHKKEWSEVLYEVEELIRLGRPV